jgi:uncharacterized protein with NRDE domain
MLSDRQTAPEELLPAGDLSPEWARKLSAPFVRDPAYGTRCSTVLVAGMDGEMTLSERRFDPEGMTAGDSELRLNDAHPTAA